MVIAAPRYHRIVGNASLALAPVRIRPPSPHHCLRRPRSHIADRKFYPSVFVARPLSVPSAVSTFATSRGTVGAAPRRQLLKSGIPFNGSQQKTEYFHG